MERLATFVRSAPGCSISAVRDELGLRDMVAAWDAVIDAEREGFVRYEKPDGDIWRIYPVDAS